MGLYSKAQSLDASAIEGLPQDIWLQNQRDNEVLLRTSATQAELIILDNSTSPSRLMEACAEGEEAHWRAETLRSGHYALETEDLESFTPQTLNYDQSERVAFDKGCYTGQEVVARLHYKGKSKRRLQVYALEDPSPRGDTNTSAALSRDAPVFGDNEEPLGKLLTCEHDAGGRAILAAEIQADRLGSTARLKEGLLLTPLTPDPLSKA